MLDIQHLSFAVTNEAAGKEILHDITLTVDSGRFVVITGPNGGGKSTLAKMIAGYKILDAEGVYLYTKDQKLIDSVSSWWCMIHGYKHPELTAKRTVIK